MFIRRWIRTCMLCLTIAFVLVGCWNRRELPELAIISAIGIDKAENSNEYLISFQIVKVKKKSGSQDDQPSTVVFHTTGKTIFEAIRKISNTVSRELFFSHVQFIAIGENLARHGISDVIDFFERSHETRLSSYVLIAREMKAEDVVSAISPLEPIEANAVIDKLKLTKRNWSHNVLGQVDDIIRALNDPGIDPTISGIRLTGEAAESSSKSNFEKTRPKSSVEIQGVALFKGDKLIGWLDDDHARGFVRLKNTMKSSITTVDCKERKDVISIETLRSKSQIKTQIVNGKPSFQVHILEEGIISEINCKLPLDKADTINELEQIWKEKIEEEVVGAVQETKKKQVDPSGFGLALSRHYPKFWSDWSESWGSFYTKCPVSVSVETNIQRTGMRNKSFKK